MTGSTYATASKFAKGVNNILEECHLPKVTSTLELFARADKKFVPSCYSLEKFEEGKVIFCGS